MHREIQIKQFPIVTTHWWPKTRNERFVWENEQYLYRFLPLVHNHVQVIWVHTHIRCVTCVCVTCVCVCVTCVCVCVCVCVCDVCVRALWLTLHSHGASASTLDGGRVWSVVLTQLFKRQRRRQPIRSPHANSVVLTRRHSYNNQSHTSLVLHERDWVFAWGIQNSVHVLFPSYRDSDLYLPLYDWQTRTVWPKNIKIGSTEEKKTPTSWMPLG